MKRLTGGLWVITLILALVLAGVLAGCGDTSKANEAIARANAQIDAYNKVDAEVSALLDEAAKVPETQTGATKGVQRLDEAKRKLASRKGSLAKAKAEFVAVAKMDVSKESKTYAAKEIATVDALSKLDEALAAMIVDMRGLMHLIASGSKDAKKAGALADSLQAKQSKLEELQTTANALERDAKTYFEENLKK